jgi:hypothetical protein
MGSTATSSGAASSTWPLGLSGTQWLLIAAAAAVLIWLLFEHKRNRP